MSKKFVIDEGYSLSLADSATPSQEILAIVREALDQSPYAKNASTPEKLQEMIQPYLAGVSDHRTGILLHYENQIVGVLLGLVSDIHGLAAIQRTAYEILWYVVPEHRKGKPSRVMLEAFEEWARTCGCSKVIMGDFGGKLSKYYSRKGYTLAECAYVKDV